MNLQPLKVIIPGRVMLVMLLLLGLVLGWYFVTSGARGDHLVRRNFNHLNQVAANIDASVDSLLAQVRFTQRNLECLQPSELMPMGRNDRACMQKFIDEIVDNSLLIKDRSSIRTETKTRDFKDWIESRDGWGGQLTYDALGDPCIDPDSFETEQESVGISLVKGGIRVEINIIMDFTRQDLKFIESARTVRCLDAQYVTRLEIDLLFADILQGRKESGGYFDSLIIARPTGATAGDKPVQQVLYHSAASEPYSRISEVRDIFSANTSFERFGSIYELEHQNGIERRKSSLLAAAQGKSPDQDVEPASFTQSTVVPFDVGGFSHLAFVQPLRLQLDKAPGDLLLIGVVQQSKFNTLKYSVPLNYLSMLLVGLVVVILSMNFIRLALIGKKGVLLRRDLHLSYASLLGMASLITILIGNVIATIQFNTMFEQDRQAIFDRASSQFQYELLQKLYLMHPGAPTDWCAGELQVAAARTSLQSGTSSKLQCTGEPQPDLSSLFDLSADGEQMGIYASHLKNSPELPFNVSARDYFKVIRNGQGWQFDASQLRALELRDAERRKQLLEDSTVYTPEQYSRAQAKAQQIADQLAIVDGDSFFIQRIESYVDGRKETAISTRFQSESGQASEREDLPLVTVAITRFPSLEDVVLPPGFGLAVFENTTGKVLYHSDKTRSLRENFYRATDDNPDLKAAIVAGVRMPIALNYKGEQVESLVAPLGDTPWSLAVYYRSALVDTVNFHFGVTASVLSAVFIVLFLCGAWLLSWVWQTMARRTALGASPDSARIVPHWAYPMHGKGACYDDLAATYFALLWLYTGVTYYLDITWSWPWLLLVPMMIFWLWHRKLRPEYYHSLPAPLRSWVGGLPYLFAGALSMSYVVLVSLRGGLVYLLLGAAASIAVQLLRKRRYRKQLASESHEGRSSFTMRVGLGDASNYRFCACIFVLLLSVSPTIMLYNENFDVHEKLWLEYSSWSNADGLRARAEGYRQYATLLENPDELSGYLFDHWAGVYLPRTEIYGLAESIADDFVASPVGEEPDSRLQLARFVDRWPPLQNKGPLLPMDYDREFTVYLLAARDEVIAGNPCHHHLRLMDGASLQCAAGTEVDDQVALLKSLVKMLPSFSTTGSLLESFTERTDLMHDNTRDDDDSLFRDPLRLIGIDEYNPTIDTYYLMSTVFPHTRSAYTWVIMLSYVLFLSTSGVIIFQLTGFLMRRQLGVKFSQRLPKLDRIATEAQIREGVLLVVPAGMDMDEASRLLKSAGALATESFVPLDEASSASGMPRLAGVEASENFVLLKSFCDIVGSQTEAGSVIAFVEAQCKAGKKLLVLSEIDPRYWLQWRHVDDQLPDSLFFRWESQLLMAQTYCLRSREHRRPASPASYRQSWQRCSIDEQLLLAGLHYEGVVNYQNMSASISLYRRRLLGFANFQFHFPDPGWEAFVQRQMSKDQFRSQAARYENKLWLSFRGPILLALLVTLGFIAYVAQDEMRIAFSLLATVGGTIATVGAFSERLRDFRAYLGN